HPLAMAGVDEHSAWREDPVGRLAATSAYLTIVTYGERAAAERAAARVRKIHTYVRGTDPVTGQPYAADDPALLPWVHAALVDAAVLALPAGARELHGFADPPPLTPERRTEIRQALGVLDAVQLAEPGVLEARQRITLRMRSAARA